MAATANAAQLLLDATSPRIVPVTLPTNVTVPNPQVSGLGTLATANTADWATQVVGAGKPSNYADVTTTIMGNSGTSIVMTNANLFKSSVGLGGVFIGSGGLFGKDTSGNTTFSINGTTGAAEFRGNITGGASLDITGNALFKGAASSGGFTYAGLFNTTGAASGGIRAFGSSTGAGVRGENASSGDGVFGQATSGYGVRAMSNTGTALYAEAPSGTAINCKGAMVKTGTELVGNLNAELWGSMKVTANTTGSGTASFSGTNKPGSSTSNTWLVIDVLGTPIYIPVWT